MATDDEPRGALHRLFGDHKDPSEAAVWLLDRLRRTPAAHTVLTLVFLETGGYEFHVFGRPLTAASLLIVLEGIKAQIIRAAWGA